MEHIYFMSALVNYSQAIEIINKISIRSPEIHIRGHHIFSRGPARECNSTLRYDEALESLSKALLFSQIPWTTLNARHQKLTSNPHDFTWPNHAPYRIVEGMGLGGRENVFMIFPYAYGVSATKLSDTACIELVEFTEQISARIIAPAVRLAFSNSREVIHELNRIPVACSIYIYAILHEAGHYEGPYSLTHIKQYNENPFIHLTGSELFADLYSFSMSHEIRPATLLQVLLRLFWYLPKNSIHEDSDVAVSYYILNELVASHALQIDSGQLSLDLNKMSEAFSNAPDTEKIKEFCHHMDKYNNKLQPYIKIILKSIEKLPKHII